MSFKDRLKLVTIIFIVSIVVTIILMMVRKRVDLYGFIDMAFFTGLASIVIGVAVKGGRVYGRDPRNRFKRFIPESPKLTESEKIENKIQDIAVGWTFIFCGIVWAGVAGASYLLLGM